MPMLKWAGKEKVVNHYNDVPFKVLERKWGYGDCSQISIEHNCSQITNANAVGSRVPRDRNGRAGSTLPAAENMIIHGDNLAALKALLPQYEGRVKCIYIDPPYNTGNEGWVYNDNVNDPLIKKWLGEVVGKEGEDFSRHDKWLCMMYPRLRLLQKLLLEDGAIFISIDDNEFSRLRFMCDEVFGQDNFVASLIWRKADSPSSNTVPLISDHEYILVYAKVGSKLKLRPMEAPEIVDAYGIVDEHGRRCRDSLLKKNGRSSLRKDRPTMFFPIIAPDGSEVFPIHDNGEEARWSMGRDGVERLLKEGRIVWKRRTKMGKEVWEPYTREYAPDNPTRPYPTIWGDLHTMRQAKAQLREIFETADLFDTPKPVNLIERILRLIGDKDGLVLDSFAGSGTTAHAVLKMNKEDGGNRKFILVELMDYAETVTAERVKQVISGYGEGDKAVEGTGGGFGYYELGEPLMIGENLNEDLPVEKIREYVWYMETRGAGGSRSCATEIAAVAGRPPYRADTGRVGIPLPAADAQERVPPGNDPYLLGVADGTAYYFCYEKGKAVKLNRALLRKLKTKAERYVIYADICLLDDSELEKYNITFKKIPRDIARL